MLEDNVVDRPVSLARERVKRPLEEPDWRCLYDRLCFVVAERIDHDDIVALSQRVKAAANVDCFVLCQDEGGVRHVESGSRRPTSAGRDVGKFCEEPVVFSRGDPRVIMCGTSTCLLGQGLPQILRVNRFFDLEA